MINLIPNEEKKKMNVDFYYRLLTLFLLMLSFSVLVAFVAILPAYFFSSMQDSVINTKLEIQKQVPIPTSGEQSLAIIKDVNTKLGLIENAENNEFSISQKVIKAIVLDKTPNIKIVQILYENDPILGKKISILGTASSRETLLAFEEALEEDGAFKNVDLPISNFVKESNIQFNLNLMPS